MSQPGSIVASGSHSVALQSQPSSPGNIGVQSHFTLVETEGLMVGLLAVS